MAVAMVALLADTSQEEVAVEAMVVEVDAVAVAAAAVEDMEAKLFTFPTMSTRTTELVPSR